MKHRPADRRPQKSHRGRPRAQDQDEQKFHGRHACHALFAHRRDDIIRVYVDEPRVKEFSPLLKWCAEQRRAYHIVEDENLERLAETVHHQGIVILAKKGRELNDDRLLESIRTGQVKGALLYLDGVQNPHNLGSILRTSAHFGVGAVIGRRDQLPGVTASAARVAEGGAETVPLARLGDPARVLSELKSVGYRLFATASGDGGNVYKAGLTPKSVIILGNEVHGVSPEIAALADESLQIPGTGAVESLNVGVACAVLISEVTRRAHTTTGDKPAPPTHNAPGRQGHRRPGRHKLR
jgi:TrmH RNA methyltransferase